MLHNREQSSEVLTPYNNRRYCSKYGPPRQTTPGPLVPVPSYGRALTLWDVLKPLSSGPPSCQPPSPPSLNSPLPSSLRALLHPERESAQVPPPPPTTPLPTRIYLQCHKTAALSSNPWPTAPSLQPVDRTSRARRITVTTTTRR